MLNKNTWYLSIITDHFKDFVADIEFGCKFRVAKKKNFSDNDVIEIYNTLKSDVNMLKNALLIAFGKHYDNNKSC